MSALPLSDISPSPAGPLPRIVSPRRNITPGGEDRGVLHSGSGASLRMRVQPTWYFSERLTGSVPVQVVDVFEHTLCGKTDTYVRFRRWNGVNITRCVKAFLSTYERISAPEAEGKPL